MSDSVRALRASKLDLAITLTKKIIRLQPKHPGAHAVQFSCLFKAKEFEQARLMGGTAAELNPSSVFILNNQACLQLDGKQPAAAAGLLKSLIDQYGERGQWLYNLALAQRMVGNFENAISAFRRTLDHQPDHHRAAFQLADCLSVIGRHEEAVQAYDYVRLIRSSHAPSHSNFIHNAVANGGISEIGLRQELRLWEDRFVPNDKHFKMSPIKADEPLNIGFLLGVVPQSWLESIIAPVINEITKRGDHVIVYWHAEKLPASALFIKNVKVVECATMSDANFARRGRADKIQILIDVCGMRLGSRQRALGLQLGNQEFGWLAHEGAYATPLVNILDHQLGDRQFYVATGNKTSTSGPPVKTLSGIGCQAGISDIVIKTWGAILQRLPDWQLHLDCTSKLIKKTLCQRFAELGISADRLNFDASLTIGEQMVVLDNFVENDPVAASQALANGGVLVALRGDLFPAQQTAAILKQMGREQWLAKNRADYIEQACAWAMGEPAQPLTKEQIEKSEINNLTAFVDRFSATIRENPQ